jgi:spore coat protein CotH
MLLALLLGCGAAPRDDSTIERIPGHTGEPDDTGTPCAAVPTDDAGYADLFDATRVHAVALTLDAAEQAALQADPHSWVLADLVVDARELAGVGVQWRGDADQQRWDGKPGFDIGLLAFDGCDTVGGVTRLTLDAGTDDAAQGRQVVASAVLTEAGALVSRAAYATVTVNGDPFGLYTLVEAVEPPFFARRGAAAGGLLWEGSTGADFTIRGLDAWDLAQGVDDDQESLTTIADVLAGAGTSVFSDANALVDMNQFLAAWAMLAAIGHGRSYPHDTDDVYLYADVDGRFRFVSWELDEGWDPAFVWNHVDGALGVRCVYDPLCDDVLRAHLQAALATLEGIDVPRTAEAAFALSSAPMIADARRGTSIASVQAERASLLTAMAAWPATLRGQLDE